MASSGLVDVKLYLHDTRDRSVMVSETGWSSDVFFLPLSQIEVALPDVVHKDARIREITMPEWLAVEKGLL
jgi:hypothetical protein